jgi:hypothetical protein
MAVRKIHRASLLSSACFARCFLVSPFHFSCKISIDSDPTSFEMSPPAFARIGQKQRAAKALTQRFIAPGVVVQRDASSVHVQRCLPVSREGGASTDADKAQDTGGSAQRALLAPPPPAACWPPRACSRNAAGRFASSQPPPPVADGTKGAHPAGPGGRAESLSQWQAAPLPGACCGARALPPLSSVPLWGGGRHGVGARQQNRAEEAMGRARAGPSLLTRGSLAH